MDTESQTRQGQAEDIPDRTGERRTSVPEDSTSGDKPFFRMAILLFLVGFLYVLHQDLSPFLIGLTLLAIIVMVRKGIRFEACVAVVVVLLFGAWLMGDMAGLFWPFVTSFVLAYLLAPLVGLMERWMSRTIAIALIVVVILGALSGIGIVVIPLVTQEILDFGRRVPVYAAMLKQFYDQIFNWLQSIGVNLPKGQIEQVLLERLPKLGELFAEQTTAALKGLSTGLATLLNFLMIPFVTFYMIKDYDRIVKTVARSLPRRHAASIGEFLERVDEILGQYLRGQMLVCSFIAVLTATGLMLFGIRYAVLLGLMAGLFNLIPYIGMAVAFSVACLVALLDADPAGNLFKVIGVFVVVQSIEGNFLSPRVVGQRVGLHPVWVMFALVVGAHFWGFIGLLIAIPGAAVLNILCKVIAERYYNSLYYKTE